MKVIDKNHTPNGKFYIRKDRTNSLTYFGIVNNQLVVIVRLPARSIVVARGAGNGGHCAKKLHGKAS